MDNGYDISDLTPEQQKIIRDTVDQTGYIPFTLIAHIRMENDPLWKALCIGRSAYPERLNHVEHRTKLG